MRRKYIPFVSTLILAMLFGTAATCNFCGLNLTTDTTAPTIKESQTDSTSTQTSETEETTKITVAENTNEEKTTDTTKSSSTDTTKSSSTDTTKSSSTDTQAMAPTIKLQIYEGPTYSQTDSICYYRIEAIVTGNPTPTIVFSKDDSNGAFGSKKVQVNLTQSNPNYTLTAKAKNAAGEDTATINLTWGCGPLNNPPKIDKLSLISMGPVVTNLQCEATVIASDPDGDTLNYEWFAAGGVFDSKVKNIVKWTAPGTTGLYNIGVKVSDGKGGEVTKSMNIDVKQQTSTNLNLNHVSAEEGYVSSAKMISNDMIVAGDHTNNASYRGFISFDITNLKGATIQDSTLTLNINQTVGDLSNFDKLWIAVVDYGANPLVFQDYDLTGTAIQSFPASGSGNITCNSSNLKTQLQNAVNAGKTRFQLRIHLSLPTDGDNAKDWLDYRTDGITLNITFLK